MIQLVCFRQAAALVLAFAVFLVGAPAIAGNALLIAPHRVVIERPGNAEVFISNMSDTATTYRVSLVLRRMNEKGELYDVAESAANDADRAMLDMVRYAPRRVTLGPQQTQTVRLSIRPPAGLPDGEYRAHLQFDRVDPIEPAVSATAPTEDPRTLEFAIRLNLGGAIPVFFRQGMLETAAGIENAELATVEGRQVLQFDMTRTGTASLYGDLIARTASGEQIGAVSGIAVYSEIFRRKITMPLKPGVELGGKGPVTIEYRAAGKTSGVLARAAVALP